jgi:hypothetical protein
MDPLTAQTYNLELQATTAPLPISTLYKSLHDKSSQSVFTSRFLVTNLNNGDSSASMVMLLPAG